MFNRHSGIALIQVLLVAAILAVLVMSYSKKSIQAMDLAQQAVTRSEALMALQQAESKVLLGLLTEQENAAVVTGVFNRYSEPFSVATQVQSGAELTNTALPVEVKVEIQDLAGLFLLAPFGSGQLPELLTQFGYSKNQAKSIALAMDDWQDPDTQTRTGGAEQAAYNKSKDQQAIQVRNAPFQTENELGYVKGMDGYMPPGLARVITFYPSGHFNPMTAPAEVLALYVSDKSRLNEVIKLRQQHKLSSEDLIRLTGIETSDTILLNHGKGSRITLTFNKAPHSISIQKEWLLSPYEQQPITLWSVKRN